MASGQKTSGQMTLRGDAGIGLVEIMIALVIFAVAALGIAATAVQVGASVNAMHERTRALTTARNQLEDVLLQPYDQVVDGTMETDGVVMEWSVTDNDASKEIVLSYRYSLPRGTREDTITAGLPKP